MVEFREKEKNQEDQGEEVHGCYRQSAKRKGRKEERKKKKKKERKKERGRRRALWYILEFGGSGREKKRKEGKK